MDENNGYKLFISYCHADEKHKDKFISFLATLKRNKIISEWNDRQLLAGSKLTDEIITNIEESDIICLLISQDFLNSYFCVEEELSRALGQVKNGKSRIFPIILDHSTWLDTEISNYTAVPKDGKEITTFDNENKAWLEVVEHLKEVVKHLDEIEFKNHTTDILSPPVVEIITESESIALTQAIIDDLQSTEITLQSKYKEIVTLDDIYVHPDLKFLDEDISEHEITKNAEFYADFQKIPSLSIILGEEQSGKSSFAKQVFQTSIINGALPIFIKCRHINKSSLEGILKKLVPEQYENLTYDDFKNSHRKKVFIIDDFTEIKLNSKYQKEFINSLVELSDSLVVLSDESLRYDENIYSEFDDFEQYEILPFGYERRDELLRKWHSLGREEEINESELAELVDVSAENLDSIIRKNIVPRKPIFILMLLQTLEGQKASDFSLTSHGYCYQMLIQQNLNKVKIRPDETDKYINYLTQISYFIYQKGRYDITETELTEFKSNYKFHIKSHEVVIEKLLEAKLLKCINGKFSIRYKYIYYFYIAKYMSDSQDPISFVNDLCDKMHTEQHANILIFVTHHTKNEQVIAKIIKRSTDIFKDQSVAKLGKEDTNFLKEFMDEIPKLVVKHRNDVKKSRKLKLKAKDSFENNISEEEEMSSELLSDVNKSIRSIEIIGQIIKNRHSSIGIDQLNELSEEAIKVGLRFLNFYLTSCKDVKNEIIDMIYKLIEQESNLSDEEISDFSKKTFMQIVYSVSFNVIKKISFSIGHRELVELFSEIRKKNENPAFCLIDASISLEFKSNKTNLPISELEGLWKNVEHEFLARRLMQDLVLQHQYLNYVSFKDKSWINSKLGIPIEIQERLQSNKKLKKLSRSN